MSAVLAPGMLLSQTHEMSESCRTCLSQTEKISSSLETAADPKTQQGQAWENVRAHLGRREQLTGLFAALLQSMVFECGSLSDLLCEVTGAVEDEVLDMEELLSGEQKLTEMIDGFDRIMEQASRDAANARALAVAAPDPVSASAAVTVLTNAVRLYQETGEDREDAKAELEEIRKKIRVLENFLSESASLFERQMQLASSLSVELSLASSSWDKGSGRYVPDGGAAERLRRLDAKAQAGLAASGMRYIHIPADALSFWSGAGLDEDAVAGLAAGIKTEDDRDFFRDLLGGRYQEAFRKDPEALSESSLILACSAFHSLLGADLVSEGEMCAQKYLNGMLYTDLMCSPYGDRDHHSFGQAWLTSMKETSDKVLKSLSAGALAGSGLLSPGEKEEMHAAAAENALWGALEACACSEEVFDLTCGEGRIFGDEALREQGGFAYETGLSEGTFYGSTVTGLTKQQGDRYSFGLDYHVRYLSGALWGEDAFQYGEKTLRVPCRSEVLCDPGAMQFEVFEEEMQALRRDRDTLGEELTRQEILSIAAGFPGVGHMISLLRRSVNAVLGDESGAKISAAKSGLGEAALAAGIRIPEGEPALMAGDAGAAADLIGDVLDYAKEIRELDAAIDQKDALMHRYYFGSMSVYEAGDAGLVPGEGLVHGLSGSGYYSPEKTEALRVHEEGGLRALLERSGKEPAGCARVMDRIEQVYASRGEEIPEEMQTLLYGGSSMFEMNGESTGRLFSQLEAVYDEAMAPGGYPAGFGPDLGLYALFR